MSKKKSVAEILQQEINKRSFITGIDMNVEKLFQSAEVKEWAENLLENDETSELVQRIENASTERLTHAVTTYLLGIFIRERLNLNFDFLPRIFSKGSFGDAFYFFWSIICICHDLGYQYETGDYDQNLMDTHEGRRSLLEIEYDMFDVENNIHDIDVTVEEKEWILRTLDLTRKYDRMRRSTNENIGNGPQIDHGIAGALILYDVLMKEYLCSVCQRKNQFEVIRYINSKSASERENISGEVSSNVCSNRFEACVILIACTVARHNMWIANADTSKCYHKFGLSSLCCGQEGAIVSTKKALDQMLFMLDFMDTIDPVKGIYTREAERMGDSRELENRRYLLLNDITIGFEKESDNKYRWESALKYQKFTISLKKSVKDEGKKIFHKYAEGLKGLDNWLKTKAPDFQADREGLISGVTLYYPNIPRKQRMWVGGITENEIIALCLYEGSGGNGKAGPFYQYHNAYQTLNLLMMDGLEGEEIRICEERQNPHGLYIQEWKKTLEVMTDIFTSQCKFMEYWHKEEKKLPVIYRADRKVNFNMMQTQKRTFAFTSTSKKGYLENIVKYKKNPILQEIVLTKEVPFVEYESLLQEMYVDSEEQEVLLPPFLKICEVKGPCALSIEERNGLDINQDEVVQKYVVILGGFEICDDQEDEMILIKRLEMYKKDAAEVLEEIKKTRTIDMNVEQIQCYLNWKNDFQTLVKHCFFNIGAAYGLVKQ